MSIEKIALIIEVVLLCLLTIAVLYYLITIIMREAQIKKTAKLIDKATNKFMKKIDDAVVECINEDNNKIKKMTTQNNNNYNEMNVIELKKIAQKRKIKGYYNLHKEELIKALEETETLQK